MKTRSLRRASVSLLAVVALALTPGAQASFGATEPADAVAQDGASEAVIDRVDEVAGALADYWQEPGFAQTEVQYDRETVILRWSGAIPPDVSQAIRLSDSDVRVVVEEVRLSESEVVDAQLAIVDSGVIQNSGYQFSSGAPTKDFSGIVIQVAPTGKAESRRSLESAISSRHQRSQFAHVPVEVEYVEESAASVPARSNDSAPWKGGGRIENLRCSTGFSVLVGSQGMLLSAAHCHPGMVSRRVDNGSGTRIAPAANVRLDRALDSALIDPTASPATIGRVFRGAWNGTAFRNVHAAASASVNRLFTFEGVVAV